MAVTTVVSAVIGRIEPGALLATVLLAGCSPRLPSVPVTPSLEIQRLQGAWIGEYQNGLTGRIGTIEFTLHPGNGVVHGNMVLRGSATPQLCRKPVQASVKEQASNSLVITVKDSRLADSSSDNHAEQSSSPKQRCLVDTWFEGVFREDTLGGTYFSRLSGAIHWPWANGGWYADFWMADKRRRGDLSHRPLNLLQMTALAKAEPDSPDRRQQWLAGCV
jgi:hypothetical protein